MDYFKQLFKKSLLISEEINYENIDKLFKIFLIKSRYVK